MPLKEAMAVTVVTTGESTSPVTAAEVGKEGRNLVL